MPKFQLAPIEYASLLPEKLNEEGDIEIFCRDINIDRLLSALKQKLAYYNLYQVRLSNKETYLLMQVPGDNSSEKNAFYQSMRKKLISRKTHNYYDYSFLPEDPQINNATLYCPINISQMKSARNIVICIQKKISKHDSLKEQIKASFDVNQIIFTFLIKGSIKEQKVVYKKFRSIMLNEDKIDRDLLLKKHVSKVGNGREEPPKKKARKNYSPLKKGTESINQPLLTTNHLHNSEQISAENNTELDRLVEELFGNINSNTPLSSLVASLSPVSNSEIPFNDNFSQNQTSVANNSFSFWANQNVVATNSVIAEAENLNLG